MRVEAIGTRSRALLTLLGLAGSGMAGCDAVQTVASGAPRAAQVAEYYQYAGDLDVEMSGNVAQITVQIDRDEYRMGGRVWAMASPYVFLFSPATRDAFDEHSGLGGVRVIVTYPDGSTLAQALLDRNTLNEVTWQRALNVAGMARSEGTESPGYMRDLVRFGEENTDFQYNREYIELP